MLKAGKISLIFSGGPGSMKGLITQDLAHEFDFITINAEEIVFSYLPNKVANTVTNTVEMQTLMKVGIVIQNTSLIF
jgi:hypothetical protein